MAINPWLPRTDPAALQQMMAMNLAAQGIGALGQIFTNTDRERRGLPTQAVHIPNPLQYAQFQENMRARQARAQALQNIAADPNIPEGVRSVMSAFPEEAVGQYVRGAMAQGSQADNPFAKIDPADYTRDSFANFVRTGDYAELVPAEKMAKPPSPITARPGDQVVDPVTGKVIFSVPDRPEREAFTLSEGQVRYGPDGKPIAAAPGRTARPEELYGGLDKERFNTLTSVIKDFRNDDRIKKFNAVQPQIGNARAAAAAAPNAANDRALVTTFSKLLDPTTGVLQGEAESASGGITLGGLVERAKGFFDAGQTLPPAVRQELIANIDRLDATMAQQLADTRMEYEAQLEDAGIPKERLRYNPTAAPKSPTIAGPLRPSAKAAIIDGW